MTTPLNVVTDSLYVAGLVARIQDARIRDIQNERLFDLLRTLQSAIRQRQHAYTVIYKRSHKWEEGLGEGNKRADDLVAASSPQVNLLRLERRMPISTKMRRDCINNLV